MGTFLDQCASDAWDVICGKKKIIGNRIVNCNKTKIEEKKVNEDYGWLAPNGTFYSVEFANHQAWASKYLLDEYRKGNIELLCDKNPGDKLCEMGFILIHNPHGYNFSVTRDKEKRITNNQRDFLINYFEKRNMEQWLNKVYRDQL